MTANAVTMDPMDPASSRGKSAVVVVVVDDDNNPSLSPSLVDDGDVDNITDYGPVTAAVSKTARRGGVPTSLQL